MYENLPLITLDDLDPEQTITNGRKSSCEHSTCMDSDVFCIDPRDNDTDGDTASDGTFYDSDQQALDVQVISDDDDSDDADFDLVNVNGDDILDEENDYDDGDDDDYDTIIEDD